MRFADKVAIVTGGSSGIGEAAVKRLVQEGATVVNWSISADKGERVAAAINAADPAGRVLFQRVDVTQWEDVQRGMQEVRDRHGRLDVLVNNVGDGTFGQTPDLSAETWHRTIGISLDSIFYCCKEGIPLMRLGGGGAIVNVASVSGVAADYGLCAYNAAKGGAINYSRCLAIDHIREGIRVNCVCPGLVDTPAVAPIKDMFPELIEEVVSQYPRGAILQADEIASIILFLASPESSALIGATLVADGGMTSWTGSPKLDLAGRDPRPEQVEAA